MNFNMQQMMKQAQAQAQVLQKKFLDMQEQLEKIEVVGESGGGSVTVTITAQKNNVKRVFIDPKLMIPEDKEILEDLIVAAFNNAKRKAESVVDEEMQKAGISPDLLKMINM